MTLTGSGYTTKQILMLPRWCGRATWGGAPTRNCSITFEIGRYGWSRATALPLSCGHTPTDALNNTLNGLQIFPPTLMRATRPFFLRLTLLLLLLVCSASMLVYWNRLPGALHAANVRTGLPNAKPLTDLYPRWYGTRELLLYHRDPYGVEVSREIQIAYYGRALDPSVAADRLDQERFAYPLYVIFLMLPTVPMEFDTVRVVVWWFLAAVTAAELWCWLRFLRIQLSVIAGAAVFALALTSLPVLQGLRLLPLGLLV